MVDPDSLGRSRRASFPKRNMDHRLMYQVRFRSLQHFLEELVGFLRLDLRLLLLGNGSLRVFPCCEVSSSFQESVRSNVRDV